jgi:hypothetical protein
MVHGIVNHGAMCYCNSTVQMLYSMPEFREFIMRSAIDTEPLTGLKNIFQNLSSPGNRTIDIKSDFLSLRTECMENMTDEELLETQEDASEFLTDCIFRKLEFIGQLPEFLKITKKSMALCNGIPEEGGEPSTGPSLLPIDFTAGNIQDNLINTLREESMLGRCPEGYIKHNFFADAPPKYVILSLNRFVYNNKKGVREKVDRPVEINNIVDIPFEGRNVKYKIKGFISHVGASATGGHYYYTGKGDDGEWRVYNDVTIGKKDYVDEGTYLGIGALEKKRAYILLYELADAAPTANANVGALNRRMGHVSLANERAAAAVAAVPANRSPNNKRRTNVTRGRRYNKKAAIEYLGSRPSVSPNTRNRASRKIKVRPKNKEFTEQNIRNILNFTRQQKEEEKK